MADILDNDIESIVASLLLSGDSVVEISGDLVILQAWDNAGCGMNAATVNWKGKNLKDIDADHILAYGRDWISTAMQNSGKGYCEFLLPSAASINRFAVKIMPGTGNRLVLIELLPAMLTEQVVAENWRQAVDALVSSQRNFYEKLLNNVAADVVVFDSEFRFLYVNPVAIKDAALRSWLIGKTDADFCVLRDRPLDVAHRRMANYRKAVKERRMVEFEEQSINRLGEVLYHVRRVLPLFKANGELDIIVGFGLDITDRVVAQQALKLSQETFSSVFNYSGIGMALVDMEGKWKDVNNVFCLMTGYSQNELLKQDFRNITFPADIKSLRELARRMQAVEVVTETMEIRFVAKDKTIVWGLLTVSLVWKADGAPDFFIVQVVDITKKKALEIEIRRKNVELEASKQSLVSKVEQLEELSYIVAHNLRGPAGNIKTLAEAMSERFHDSGGASANALSGAISDEECIRFIEESSNSLLNSLDTLMQIATIKLNTDIPKQECDVAAMVHEICSQLQSSIYSKQAVIETTLECETIVYPKAYLENILYNLVSNSLKYNRPGIAPEIKIAVTKRAGKVIISVKDNGLGIDMERHADRVFKPNQVFHKGFDSKGIGLYITKTQIESLGGSILLLSKPNEGCEFIVAL